MWQGWNMRFTQCRGCTAKIDLYYTAYKQASMPGVHKSPVLKEIYVYLLSISANF
jgi:hypothetical protein